MNFTGCPAGYARDQFLDFRLDEPCRAPYNAFLSLVIILLFVRFASVLASIALWRAINKRRKERPARSIESRSSRFPIVPTIMVIDFVVVTLFFSCYLAGLVFAHDGYPALLLMFWSMTSFPLICFQMLKVFGLSSRIHRRMKQNQGNRSWATPLQYVLFLLLGVSVVGQVVFAILGVANPGQYAELGARGTLACLTSILILSFTLMGVEYQRCINELKTYRKSTGNITAGNDTKWTEEVIYRLRLQRVAYVVGIPIVTAPLIYFLATLIFVWYMWLIFFFVSCMITVGILVSLLPLYFGKKASQNSAMNSNHRREKQSGSTVESGALPRVASMMGSTKEVRSSTIVAAESEKD